MRILFICGSLEPGLDGVGDYTRRIAAELTSTDILVFIIALYDRSIKRVNYETQYADSVKIRCLRIPFYISKKERFALAGECIREENPNWISLQYVPFAFQGKGLPFGFSQSLESLVKGRHLQIMFHEIWVGTLKNASLKLIFLGWLQRQIITGMLKRSQPDVIHTQTSFYYTHLRRVYRNVKYLPLFSNISLQADGSASVTRTPYELTLILFGTIHPNTEPDALISYVKEYSRQENVTPLLRLIGRNGSHRETWINKWLAAGMKVDNMGELSAELISQTLRQAHIGITTSAYAMLEKSGTVAAMLEHKLPILCASPFEAPRGLPFIAPLFPVVEVKPGCIEACLSQVMNTEQKRDLTTVAEQFITDLTTSLNTGKTDRL